MIAFIISQEIFTGSGIPLPLDYETPASAQSSNVLLRHRTSLEDRIEDLLGRIHEYEESAPLWDDGDGLPDRATSGPGVPYEINDLTGPGPFPSPSHSQEGSTGSNRRGVRKMARVAETWYDMICTHNNTLGINQR